MTFFSFLQVYIINGDKMIIYIDMVFLLNILLDFILLMSVSVILTRNASVKRLILGSMIGGVSTTLLFIEINSLLLFILKIILGIVMVIVTFSYKSFKYTFNNLFYLLTISFILSGILYLFMDKGYYNYLIILLVFIIIPFIYYKQIKKYQENYSNYYQVVVYYQNKEYDLTGFLDTGNKLYDLYKNRPVILTDYKIPLKDSNIIYVPFSSVNMEGVIKCFKPDKLIVNNKEIKNYLVGLSNNKIKIDGVNVILHSKMKGIIS